jgi:hypothetical protein
MVKPQKIVNDYQFCDLIGSIYMHNDAENTIPIEQRTLPVPPQLTSDSIGDRLSDLIGAHRKAIANVDSASDQEATLLSAFANEEAALDRLLRYSPSELSEVRIKTAYFLQHLDFLGCEDPRMVMFLRAMI